MAINITECFSCALNSGAITSVKFNPFGDKIAVATSVGHIFIFTEGTSEPSIEFPPSDGPINQITWDSTSLYIYAVTEAGTLWLYNTEDLTVIRIFTNSNSPLLSCTSSPINSYISTGSTQGDLSLFKSTDIINNIGFPNTDDKEKSKYDDYINTVKGHSDAITTICFQPDGELLLTCSYDTLIRCWTTDLICVRSFSAGKPICSCLFQKPSKMLYYITSDNSVRLVNLQGHTKRTFSVIIESCYPIGCSILVNQEDTNQRFVIGFSTGAVLIIPQKEKNEMLFYPHDGPFYSFDTHPQTMFLATGGGQNDMHFKLWKIAREDAEREPANDASILVDNELGQQVFNLEEYPLEE